MADLSFFLKKKKEAVVSFSYGKGVTLSVMCHGGRTVRSSLSYDTITASYEEGLHVRGCDGRGRVLMPGLTMGPPDAEWIGPYLWW